MFYLKLCTAPAEHVVKERKKYFWTIQTFLLQSWDMLPTAIAIHERKVSDFIAEAQKNKNHLLLKCKRYPVFTVLITPVPENKKGHKLRCFYLVEILLFYDFKFYSYCIIVIEKRADLPNIFLHIQESGQKFNFLKYQKWSQTKFQEPNTVSHSYNQK